MAMAADADAAIFSVLAVRAWLCILITYYTWSSRETLSNVCSRVKQLDFGLTQPIKTCSKDAELELALQEVRVSVCKRLCNVLSGALLLVTCAICQLPEHHNSSKLCYLAGILCFCFKLVGTDVIPLTSNSIRFCGLGFHALVFGAQFSYTHIELALVVQGGGARVVTRVVVGLLVADLWNVIGCNVILALQYLAVYWLHNEAMAAQGYSFKSAVMNEFLACGGLTLITLSVHHHIAQCAEMQKDELSCARRWQQSSRKLLAVLCDAVCALTSDLQVMEPCQMLRDLQDVSQGSADALCLSSILQKSDVPRLVSFLHAQEAGFSDLHSDAYLSVPAASLHVTFRCQKTGKVVPVQLFAVPIAHPMEQHVAHLIGIKHDGANALAREEESVADASLQHSQIPLPLRPPSQSNSSSCSGSALSVDSLATAGLGIESVSFEVDAISEDLAINSVTIDFDTAAFQGIAGPRPALSHYVLGDDDAWASLKTWLRTAANSLFVGQDPTPGPNVHLRFPGSGSVSLRAMVSEVEDILVEEFDVDAGADSQETLPVRIRLSKFEVLTKRARRFSRRRGFAATLPQPMPHIGESEREEDAA